MVLQGPAPDYDAVDANYYVTWGHFADWVNTLLEHMPQEIEAMQNDAACATPDRSTSTRRSARNGDSQCVAPLHSGALTLFSRHAAAAVGRLHERWCSRGAKAMSL